MSAGCSIVNAPDCKLAARIVQQFHEAPVREFPPPARIAEAVTSYGNTAQGEMIGGQKLSATDPPPSAKRIPELVRAECPDRAWRRR